MTDFPLTKPLLVASDLDGTLLDPSERISPRLRRVLTNMVACGTKLVLATGRPPRWVLPVLDQLAMNPLCVCANGAVVIDPAAGETVAAHTLNPAAMATIYRIADEMLADVGGVGIAVERGTRPGMDPMHQEFLVSPEYAHYWPPNHNDVIDARRIVSKPAVKMLLRNEKISSQAMFRRISPHLDPSLGHVTFSVPDGLLEVAAPGITKQTGVAEAAAAAGVDRKDVMCFGDMPNDREMLQWAGIGIAMGNADPELIDIADYVTTGHADDGVANVLSEWW